MGRRARSVLLVSRWQRSVPRWQAYTPVAMRGHRWASEGTTAEGAECFT